MTFPILTEGQTTAPPAPEFHQNTLVERGALVLPPVAGQPARIYFEVTDRGDENAVCIREVAIEHPDVAKPFETRGPDMRRLANVPIHQGETVEFGLGERQVVLSDYDSDVVPGATLAMRLIFSNGEAVSTPLVVGSELNENGIDTPGQATGFADWRRGLCRLSGASTRPTAATPEKSIALLPL